MNFSGAQFAAAIPTGGSIGHLVVAATADGGGFVSFVRNPLWHDALHIEVPDDGPGSTLVDLKDYTGQLTPLVQGFPIDGYTKLAVEFDNGDFKKGSLDVGLPYPGIPIDDTDPPPQLYLSHVGLGLELNPLTLSARPAWPGPARAAGVHAPAAGPSCRPLAARCRSPVWPTRSGTRLRRSAPQ